jgi:hypothetical protein
VPPLNTCPLSTPSDIPVTTRGSNPPVHGTWCHLPRPMRKDLGPQTRSYYEVLCSKNLALRASIPLPSAISSRPCRLVTPKCEALALPNELRAKVMLRKVQCVININDKFCFVVGFPQWSSISIHTSHSLSHQSIAFIQKFYQAETDRGKCKTATASLPIQLSKLDQLAVRPAGPSEA